MKPLHPAEHRGLRELYVMGRQLRDHWRTLGRRIEAGAPGHAAILFEGSAAAREMLGELTELTAEHGLYGRPAAQGFGARLASIHSAMLDTTLEVNQALRLAALDVAHVVTLLGYLAGLAAQRDDGRLTAFLERWNERMRSHEDAIRAASVALAGDPDAAVETAAPGFAGRAGHRLAIVAGTIGEWVDRRAGR